MPVTKKSYSGNAQPAALSSNIANNTVSIPCAALVGFPNTAIGPFVVIIDKGTTNEEKVLVSSYTTSPATLNAAAGGRGYDGTTAVAHSSGATVIHGLDAGTLQDLINFATAIGSDLPTTSAVGDSASAGASGIPADALHVHGRESFAAGASSTSAIGDGASDGTSIHPSRADHKHGRESFASGATTSSAPGDAASDGALVSPARADHKHARESAAGVPFGTGLTTTSAIADAVADGASADVARADHRHGREAFYAGVPASDVSGGAVGTSALTVHGDHAHGLGPYLARLQCGGSVTGGTPNNTTENLQCGFVNQINVSSGISDVISFPAAFTNSCDGVLVVGIAAPGNDQNVNLDPSSPSTSGFRASVNVGGSAYTGQSSLCWMAWGH